MNSSTARVLTNEGGIIEFIATKISEEQQWTWEDGYNNGAFLAFRSKTTGNCFTTDGTGVSMADCTGTAEQRFRFGKWI